VKSGSKLDVWDLAEKGHCPATSVDLGGSASSAAPIPESGRTLCADLFISVDGRPLVGHHNGAVSLFRLPANLAEPRREAEAGGGEAGYTKIDDLLVPGYEAAQVFPTLAKHCRKVDFPCSCQAEVDLLQVILAGMQPMMAWA